MIESALDWFILSAGERGMDYKKAQVIGAQGPIQRLRLLEICC